MHQRTAKGAKNFFPSIIFDGETMQENSLYQEIILDHFQNPRNFGTLKKGNCVSIENPSCGDSITLFADIRGNRIQEIAFQGKGCALSQASASLLTEYVKGRTIEEVDKMDKNAILQLLGINPSPARMKCVLLALETLKKLVRIKTS